MQKLYTNLIHFYSGLRHKFPCLPNSMKFCGNTSYGSRMFQKKFGNFSSSIGRTGAFFVKMVKIYEFSKSCKIYNLHRNSKMNLL